MMATERDIHHQSRITDLKLKRERLPLATRPERVELEAQIAELERITRGHWTDAQMRRDWERRARWL